MAPQQEDHAEEIQEVDPEISALQQEAQNMAVAVDAALEGNNAGFANLIHFYNERLADVRKHIYSCKSPYI